MPDFPRSQPPARPTHIGLPATLSTALLPPPDLTFPPTYPSRVVTQRRVSTLIYISYARPLDSMTTATFLGLPVEVRLVIYDAYLTGHLQVRENRQATNGHLRLLRICGQVHDEALPILSQFVSLSNELEINAFILNTSNAVASRVLWADVANDARVVTPSGSARQEVARVHTLESKLADNYQGAIKPAPLSHLHLALRRMTSLQRLRVFQCHRGLPITILGITTRLYIYNTVAKGPL